MNKVLLLTKGLPASGKSTWAKQFVIDTPNYKRINRDSLRTMVDAGEHSKSKEKHIRALEMLNADYFFANNFNVLVDDTNLSPHAQTMWENYAKKQGAVIVWKDFTDVSVEECIKRDLKRPESVGETVIRRMYRDFLVPRPVAPVRIEGVPNAIIVDLDGTLALFGEKNPYDRDFSQDDLNPVVARIVHAEIERNTTILYTSGRNDKSREVTYKWLDKHWLCESNHFLFMRQDGDVRKDSIVKEEIYHNEIEGKYNVLYVLDDRSTVVQGWRRLGLVCLQVAEGDF